MNLTDQIHTFTADAYARLPAEYIASFRSLIEGLAKEQFGRNAPKCGDEFPDFRLSDENGELVRGSDIWDKKRLVVKFYRGGWCPYCNLELAALQGFRAQFDDLNAELIAVAPEQPQFMDDTKQKAGATFKFLWDQDNTLAKQLGIAFQVDERVRNVYGQLDLDLGLVNGEWVLPATATFVVCQGRVEYSYVDADYMRRQDPLVLLAAVRELPAFVPDEK